MTPWRHRIGCAAIAAGLLFGAAATALAHTMPVSEATLILPKPPTGQFEIIPHETRMGDLDVFGTAFLKKSAINNGVFRFVRCSVYDSETFVFFARVKADDQRPAQELAVSEYDVKGVDLHTPSNFMVSGRYEAVVEKYGNADEIQENVVPGRTLYVYQFPERASELIFEVDEEEKIRVIRYRSQA